MPKTTITQLANFGQSIWLDYISRSMIKSGKLREWIRLGLRGMTSNPTIFNQAISQSADYDEQIVKLAGEGRNTFEIYDELTTQDVRDAADAFRGIYESTSGLDGYVSLEIDPRLAMKAQESIDEGVRLFKKVGRSNVMIKVPATSAGFFIAEELLSQGINVNVTLIFSLDQYIQTAMAFVKGMSRLGNKKINLNSTHSVASVFISRIDTTVDKLLEQRSADESDLKLKNKILALRGQAAVANSRLIFQQFEQIFSEKSFGALSKKHAKPQRVLWASTGTKNPQYSDIKYVTELIAKPTVNTLPEKTLQAFLDHGVVKEAFVESAKESQKIITALNKNGININYVCSQLLSEGIAAFEKSFNELLASIEAKARSLCVK
ncbi:MAG: transaldolase [Candidatus Omnitrophota bacterium]